MIRTTIIAASLLALAGTSAFAAPCRDAKNRFVKCPTPVAKVVRCKDGKGKFAKCSTRGARPA